MQLEPSEFWEFSASLWLFHASLFGRQYSKTLDQGSGFTYRFATCGDLFSVRSCLSDCVQFQKERAAYAFSARRANEQRHNALQFSTSNNFIDAARGALAMF